MVVLLELKHVTFLLPSVSGWLAPACLEISGWTGIPIYTLINLSFAHAHLLLMRILINIMYFFTHTKDYFFKSEIALSLWINIFLLLLSQVPLDVWIKFFKELVLQFISGAYSTSGTLLSSVISIKMPSMCIYTIGIYLQLYVCTYVVIQACTWLLYTKGIDEMLQQKLNLIFTSGLHYCVRIHVDGLLYS